MWYDDDTCNGVRCTHSKCVDIGWTLRPNKGNSLRYYIHMMICMCVCLFHNHTVTGTLHAYASAGVYILYMVLRNRNGSTVGLGVRWHAQVRRALHGTCSNIIYLFPAMEVVSMQSLTCIHVYVISNDY